MSASQLALDRVLDHVVVGEDISVLGDDEAGAAERGGARHAEEVGVGDLGGHADDLLAGQIIDIARAQGQAVGACRDGRAAGKDGGGERLLPPGGEGGDVLLQRGDPGIHHGSDKSAAAETAEQRADQARGDHGAEADALLFGRGSALLLRLFGGRIVAGRDRGLVRADVMRVGIDALGIAVFVVVFPVDPVGLLALGGLAVADRALLFVAEQIVKRHVNTFFAGEGAVALSFGLRRQHTGYL